MTNFLSILLSAAPADPNAGFDWGGMVPLVLIVVVFYFFMIRPQMKKQKEAKKFVESLKAGDEVVTNGGIYGTITTVEETTVILEIAKNVKIKVDKNVILKDMASGTK